MSIEQLKKKLESEKSDLQDLFTKFDSDRYVEFVEKYPKLWCDIYDIEENSRYHKAIINSMLAGHESQANRLLPLLEKAVEVIKIYGEELEWDGVNNPAYIQDRGKRARKFLAEINKEFGE